MTAPNPRYVDEAMARLAQAVAQPVGGSIVISTADACAIGNELRRLSALPQQAGGEDVQRWRLNPSGGIVTDHGGEYVEYTDYAALQAEVARLNEVRESLLRDLRTTTDTLIARAEAAEADARQLAASVHGAFKALGSDPPEPILKLANRYFRIERKLRKAAIGGTGSD